MAAPAQPASPTTPALSAEESLRKKFRNFDTPEVYHDVVHQHGKDPRALNFVVQFGAEKAEIALNLSPEELRVYLKTDPVKWDPEMPIRWINVWSALQQPEFVASLGNKYRFSPRLTTSIRVWDAMKIGRRLTSMGERANLGSPSSKTDLERGVVAPPKVDQALLAEVLGRMEKAAPEDKATFELMQSSLNYTSIDQEREFMCIGANWFHRSPSFDVKKKPKTKESLIPPRHWSWYALCDDSTVLTFHEAAEFPSVAPQGNAEQDPKTTELNNMRSNTLKVLKQLSMGEHREAVPFTQMVSVRGPLKHIKAPAGPKAVAFEGSSNLFYYLFEDYSAAVDIVNRSKVILEHIRHLVLGEHRTHESDVINWIYSLNRDLCQLKLLFGSYKTIIGKILNEIGQSNDRSLPTGDDVGLRLSKKACDRFERLSDQIQSLMLDAIQESLDEQKSLQDTWFNLNTQRNAQATARLTRSATLLAKLSVFFLPISFMTSYFSVEIPGLVESYTGRTYWVSFAVIASVSFVSLFFFGKVLEFITDGLDKLFDNVKDQVYEWFNGLRGGLQEQWRRRRKAKRVAGHDEGGGSSSNGTEMSSVRKGHAE